jgi:hypothetical protein
MMMARFLSTMYLTLPLVVTLFVVPSHAFVVPHQGSCSSHRRRSWRSTAVDSIEDASSLLQHWDTSTNPAQVKSDTPFDTDAARPKLGDAVRFLNNAATAERDQDSTQGRCMLGICASNIEEGVGALKSWVTNLQLPRGLLHGMDKDGVPLEFEGGVYIKYNSGGVYTFEDIRKSGLGFDALWKPGDAMLESYDGTYRGVYFQVELLDGEFRQYLVPLDLFEA